MNKGELQFFITEEIFPINDLENAVNIEANKAATTEAPAQVEKPVAPSPKIPKAAPSPAPAPAVKIPELVVLVMPMNSAESEMLTKLLAAIKKDRNTIPVIDNLDAIPPKFGRLLSFGYINELKIKMDTGVAINRSTQAANGEVIVTNSLSELNANGSLKKPLWECLKSVFL